MIRKIAVCLFFALFMLTSCEKNKIESKSPAELPEPSEIYAAIVKTAELPEMVELPQELFPYYYGIESDWFDSAVSYTCLDVLQPDEIVIVRAVSENAADDITEKLEARLAYKKKSAENYLPETIPFIRDGVIRQDGLTVSLLVSGEIDAIIRVYNNAAN